MQLWNDQRDQGKLTKKWKFNPHASPISGCSPRRRDLRCLLALAGEYKPLTRYPFGGLPSVITRHHKTTEQGSPPASCRACHSGTKSQESRSRAPEQSERLELRVFSPCPEDPDGPKMTVRPEKGWIRGLQRRRFNFGTRDQAWSHKSFCVAEFY